VHLPPLQVMVIGHFVILDASAVPSHQNSYVCVVFLQVSVKIVPLLMVTFPAVYMFPVSSLSRHFGGMHLPFEQLYPARQFTSSELES
jgi:hypothetical protein